MTTHWKYQNTRRQSHKAVQTESTLTTDLKWLHFKGISYSNGRLLIDPLEWGSGIKSQFSSFSIYGMTLKDEGKPFQAFLTWSALKMWLKKFADKETAFLLSADGSAEM